MNSRELEIVKIIANSPEGCVDKSIQKYLQCRDCPLYKDSHCSGDNEKIIRKAKDMLREHDSTSHVESLTKTEEELLDLIISIESHIETQSQELEEFTKKINSVKKSRGVV